MPSKTNGNAVSGLKMHPEKKKTDMVHGANGSTVSSKLDANATETNGCIIKPLRLSKPHNMGI